MYLLDTNTLIYFFKQQGQVAEHVAHPVSELVADLGDALIGGAAIGTRVASVLNQRDRRVERPKDMIGLRIDWAVESSAQRCM